MKNMNTADLVNNFRTLMGSQYTRLLEANPHILIINQVIATMVQQFLSTLKGKTVRILDLGCGTGFTTYALAQQIENAVVVAVDNEPVMLKQFKKFLSEDEWGLGDRNITVEFHEQDALEFLRTVPTASFDAVVSGYVLHNITREKRNEIIKEISRVMRPGGRFVNGDKIARNNESLHKQDLVEQIATFINCWGKTDAVYCLGWIEHYMCDDQADLRQNEAEVSQVLAGNGFGNIRICERHGGLDAVAIADKTS
jgi:tRNA (cmo5U34)-methyltransferase